MKSFVTNLYLIQRGKYYPREEFLASEHQHLSSLVDFDYMGSSEFEFGALPKSLKRMAAHQQDLKMVYQKDLHIHIVHALTEATFQVYVDMLKKLREGGTRLKERSGYGKSDKMSRYLTDVHFWWDIENDVMWTDRPDRAKFIIPALKQSWKYMGVEVADDKPSVGDEECIPSKDNP